MIEITLRLPISEIVGYLVGATIACLLSLLSFIAIRRTKKTPYATKVLSLGLLCCNINFLILSGISRCVAFEEFGIIQHVARGFHISAQYMVCGMAIERYIVINKPYMYLRIATEKRTHIVCGSVMVTGFVLTMLVRGLGCYARGRFQSCGLIMSVYFVVICVVLQLISFICYGSVSGTICRKETTQLNDFNHRFSENKGTMVSVMYLLNTTLNTLAYIGLSSIKLKMSLDGEESSGELIIWADLIKLVNCFIDPFIYIIWFRETRMEILKLFQVFCPSLKPKIEQMRVEIFNIQTISLGKLNTAKTR